MNVRTFLLGIICIAIGSSCTDKSASNNIPNAPSSLSGWALSASELEIQWADNSNNEMAFLVFRGYNGDWIEAATIPADQTSHIDSLLQDSTGYQYYVVARNDAGQSMPSDTITLLTLAVGTAPASPSNPLPADESSAITIRPTLEWTCSDPDGDSLDYRIYMGQGPYLNPIDSNLTVCRYTPNPLLFETRYNWRVEARDGHGHASMGPVWHFTTVRNTSPEAPSEPNPYDSQTGVPLNIILSWNCSDTDGDSLTYDIYLGPGSDRVLIAAGLSSREFDPESLAYNTQYTWHVAAKDTFDNETMGQIWSFTTRDSSYTLQTLAQGFGAIIVAPDNGAYNYGDSVSLTAVPESGWYFSGWTGDTASSSNPLIVIVHRNMTIVGHFTQGIAPAHISGIVNWPGHTLSPHTYAFADSVGSSRLYMVAYANVDPSTGEFIITIDSLPNAVSLRFEAHDDVNNNGFWDPIDAGDGWGFYDPNGDSLWNDVILISPGDSITDVNITLELRTAHIASPEKPLNFPRNHR